MNKANTNADRSKHHAFHTMLSQVHMHLFLIASVFLLACGGARSSTTTTASSSNGHLSAINELRQDAEAQPQNEALQERLAIAESIWPGGEVDRADAAIAHVLGLNPQNAVALYLKASLHALRGQDAEGLDAALALLEATAEASSDRDTMMRYDMLVALSNFNNAPNYDQRVRAYVTERLERPELLMRRELLALSGKQQDDALRFLDADARTRAIELEGCLRENWRYAGPFQRFPNTRFVEGPPAIGDGPLAESFETPGDDIITEDLEAVNCALNPGVQGGLVVMESRFSVDESGPKLLEVDLGRGESVRVYIDQQLVLEVNRMEALYGSYFTRSIELDAGEHEIEVVRAGSISGPIFISLDWAGRLGDGYDPFREQELDLENRFEAFLALRDSLNINDALRARELSRRVQGAEMLPPLALATRRRAVLADPFTPRDETEQADRALIDAIAEADPKAIPYHLAVINREQDPTIRDAQVRALAQENPNNLTAYMAYYSLMRDQGRTREAETLVTNLRQRLPNHIDVIDLQEGFLRHVGREIEADALVDEVMRLYPGSERRLQILMRRRDFEGARAEVERLAPYRTDRWRESKQLDILRASGNMEDFRELRSEIWDEAETNGGRASIAFIRADEALASGNRRDATARLDDALELAPRFASEQWLARRAITGESEFAPYRQDAAEIIERFEANEERHEDAPEVLVWDYMVTRVYPDGSSRSLIHQIHRIQSEESIERHGQQSAPGYVLHLRSIKPDGRSIEPEAIRGLDTIPLRDLAIGDYVEVEFIVTSGPRGNGGYLSNLWLFDSSEGTPFAFSEWVALVPEEMPLQVEALGSTPEAVVTQDGDLKVYRWTMEHVPSRPPEPHAVALPPFRPTLRIGVNAGWEDFVPRLRDAFMTMDIVDPDAVRRVQSIVGEETNPRVIASRLHRWIREEIELGGDASGQAAMMLAAERGEGNRLLRYMLDLAGVPAHLALAQPFGTFRPQLEASGVFQSPFVWVTPQDSEPFAMWVGSEYLDENYLPADIQGQPAVTVMGPEPLAEFEVPETGETPDRTETNVNIRFEGDVAVLNVVQTFRGAQAARWKTDVKEIPPARLNQAVAEGYVLQVLPGGQVTQLSVEGMENRVDPFVLRYTVHVPGFGRQQQGGVHVPPLFSMNLARVYASLPSRETPMRVGHLSQRTTFRIYGVTAQAQQDVGVNAAGVRYSRRVTQEGNVAVLVRDIDTRGAIVSPEQYPAFAELMRAITAAEQTEVWVRPTP